MNEVIPLLRGLLRKPAFAVISILTLSLGIAANTSVFSVVEGVLLRSLPYKDPNRLVSIGEQSDIPGARNIGFQTMLDWKARTHEFESMAVYQMQDMAMSGNGTPEQLRVLQGSADFLSTLGVAPLKGRSWTAEEATPSSDRVVLLSYGFWQHRFGGDDGVIGQTIVLNEVPYQVIGILPAAFRAYFAETTRDERPISLFLPLRYNDAVGNACRTCRHLRAIARIREGSPLTAASRDLTSVHDTMTIELPSEYSPKRRAVLVPLQEAVVDTARQPVGVIFAASAVLLLATCLNVSTLLLLRATQTQNELTVRATLGANTFQLVRRCVGESLVVSLAGGTLGVLLTRWLVPLLIRMAPRGIPRLDEVDVNGTVLLGAVVVSLVSGLAAAAIPSYQIVRKLAVLDLKPESRWTIGFSSSGTRRKLIILGLGCTFALLVSVGLLMKSVTQLLRVNPGFRSEKLIVANLNSVSPRYSRPEDDIEFFNRVVDKVKRETGIEAAAATSVLPISDNYDTATFEVEDQSYPPDAVPSADRYVITPDYLNVMGIPTIRGRAFSEHDSVNAPKVVLIGETAARKFFGSDDPIGRRVQAAQELRTIVGVVGDVRQYRLDLGPTAQFYVPLAQQSRGYMTLVIRSAVAPREAVTTMTGAVAAIDSTRALSRVSTVEELLSNSVAPRRFVLRLLAGFGACAIFLAIVGIYGTIGFAVTTRSREIGVRMALGARRSQIFAMFIRHVLRLALPGLVLGIVGASMVAPVIRESLFNVNPLDPQVVAIVGAGLIVVVLCASLVPIRRAARVDPNAALRGE